MSTRTKSTGLQGKKARDTEARAPSAADLTLSHENKYTRYNSMSTAKASCFPQRASVKLALLR